MGSLEPGGAPRPQRPLPRCPQSRGGAWVSRGGRKRPSGSRGGRPSGGTAPLPSQGRAGGVPQASVGAGELAPAAAWNIVWPEPFSSAFAFPGSLRRKNDRMDSGAPPRLPDSVLFEIFLLLDYADVVSAGRTCRQWHAVARDEVLWKELFYRYYRVARDVPRHPAAASWYEEFRRLYDCIPCVEVQTLGEHSDQVLHLSFSHHGHRLASCSKDCTVKIWNNGLRFSLLHSTSMKQYNWSYTQFSQFNPDDTLLLVSGVFMGPRASSGEIAVISLESFTLLSRVRNKPYDIFGCWLNETNLISGNLHRIGFLTSCSVLWLNNAFQGVESENMNVVKRLFKIQNLNASRIRTVMVVDCSRYGSPDLLLSPGEESGEGSAAPCQVIDLHSSSTSGGEEEEEEEEATEEQAREKAAAGLAPEGSQRPGSAAEDGLGCFLTDILEGRVRPVMTELQMETKVAQLLAKRRMKPLEPNLLSVEDGDKKYLIFTTGCLTYSPHQIGIKQLLPHQMTTAGPVLGEEKNSDKFFDPLDHVIDIHGQIIGMGLSPDHRYLYVNSRAWPKDCVISDPLQPPPIAEEIDLHVLDLKTMKEVKRALRAHRAYTPSDEFFFIFLDVSKDFVASGAEDRHGYVWDRHYDICLARLRHNDVVNSVAFSPVEQELLLTASDDGTIKVWRSPRTARILQAEKPRPRKPLFAWLTNHGT